MYAHDDARTPGSPTKEGGRGVLTLVSMPTSLRLRSRHALLPQERRTSEPAPVREAPFRALVPRQHRVLHHSVDPRTCSLFRIGRSEMDLLGSVRALHARARVRNM